MTERHLRKLTRIFQVKFDEVVRPRNGTSEVLAFHDGLDRWNRWLLENGVESRYLEYGQAHEPSGAVRITDPTGFRMLFVPTDLADRALALNFLP